MTKIKGFLNEELPREKLIHLGPESLSEVELLAILLRTGTKDKNVLDLSREILNSFSIELVSRKTFDELLKFKGIKEAKACQIIAAFEFSRRMLNKKSLNKISLSSSNEVYDFVKNDFLYLNLEKVMLVFVDTKNQVIKKEFIHEGSLNYSIIEPRKVIKKVLDVGASGFFLIHNHPSGIVLPSDDDIKVTLRLKDICLKMDIRFLDHIIVGDDFYSFFDNDEF